MNGCTKEKAGGQELQFLQASSTLCLHFDFAQTFCVSAGPTDVRGLGAAQRWDARYDTSGLVPGGGEEQPGETGINRIALGFWRDCTKAIVCKEQRVRVLGAACGGSRHRAVTCDKGAGAGTVHAGIRNLCVITDTAVRPACGSG